MTASVDVRGNALSGLRTGRHSHDRESTSIADRLGSNVVSIQFLRFVAAAMVVLYHASVMLAGSPPRYPLRAFVSWFSSGGAGVHIFFCISGFVMVFTSYCKGARDFSIKTFLAKRIVRIYPIYWVCCALYLLYAATLAAVPDLSPKQIAGAFLLLPRDSALIIGPGWTLSFELYFYLTFALAMLAGLRVGLTALTAFFVVCVAFGKIVQPRWIDGWYLDPMLLEFAAGAWVGYAVLHLRAGWATLGSLALPIGVAWFVALFILRPSDLPVAVQWGPPSLLVLAGFVCWEATGGMWPVFARLSFLGASSYLLYLLHLLLLEVATTVLPLTPQDPGTAVALAAGLVVLCVAVAHVGYLLVEKPMLRRLQGVIFRRSAAR
jgi:exopolysaccharide production protein ExoZ